MSIWKSDKKLRSFASLISPSKIILFGKKYQAFDAVFITRWNTLEDRQKIRRCASYFNSVLGFASGDETLCLMLDILLLTSNIHCFFESTEMKTQHCHLLFHFFSSLFFVWFFFFSLSPSAFTFKGHNSLMKSICGRTWRFDCMYFMRRRLSFYRAFNCICLVIRQTKGWIEAVRASPQQSSTIKI